MEAAARAVAIALNARNLWVALVVDARYEDEGCEERMCFLLAPSFFDVGLEAVTSERLWARASLLRDSRARLWTQRLMVPFHIAQRIQTDDMRRTTEINGKA